MTLVTGTIRKAQNLLKQYSQHGLDGKKGGSNLIPLEGNHPMFLSVPSSTVCPLTWQGRASPRRASGETLRGAGWEWQVPGATQASVGTGIGFVAFGLVLSG